jgi:peptidoglycan/xylan/chitin deacetylase (PgdA/CDA1 family)
MKLVRCILVAALSLAAPVSGELVAPSPPAAAGPAVAPGPAFYTYQAPGGASTAGQKVIALTFDDGPGPFTPQILTLLEQYHVPATFFEVGIETVNYPQYTRLVAAAGYPVEDHTWTHANLTTIPLSGFAVQIDQTQQRIQSLTGVAPKCVRPPYDAMDSAVSSQLAARGLTTMSYSIDPKDWALPGASTIAAQVISAARPGAVVDLHDAGGNRVETVDALPQIITSLRAEGYSFVSICDSVRPGPAVGRSPVPTSVVSAVFSFGNAPAAGTPVVSKAPLVGSAIDRTGRGYWLAAADGSVFASGDTPIGGRPALHLAQHVVAMAATPDGRGYWLVGSDGGVFAFGDAIYAGSTGNLRLTKPVVGMAATADGRGYWLVGSDGGVFAFGDAGFFGSTGAMHLAQPVVGMATTRLGRGYWLLASDGGLFTFGRASFMGSGSGRAPADTFFGLAASPTGGYLLSATRPSA